MPSAKMGPLVAPPASVRAAELIREAIIDGRLKPGERLKEEELAQQFQISRTPVREALLILQTEGMLDGSPNRGAVVRGYDAQDLAEIYDIRAALEGLAAHHAALQITDEQIERLRENLVEFEKLDVNEDLREVMRMNLEFHGSIIQASGSAHLATALRSVVALPLIYAAFAWYSPAEKKISDHYHAKILTALERRDAVRADFLMREHIYEARDLLVAGAIEHED